ncbi:hypothetical protein JOF42_002347 [Microbacterium phyllosphaerae]|uniref:Uncharacterized protein n=1 Tax=Microbacterium phyllosphaerae TaxID=124798 RepID=A0ABS4WRK7_9MICO|nr:hypothetical protein [Microbacterium phyllosphaerae]MBP2378852.1 hypothetical protein [Microbacterium phyllosphaerae]
MALDALKTEIDGYRAKAIAEISQYRELHDKLKTDPSLTPLGKQEVLADAHRLVTESVAKIQKQEETAIATKAESLQRSLVARIGTSGGDLVAMRDAEERADRLEDDKDAMRTIERAIRSDDRPLAHAVIRKANESGWADVVNKAAEAYPSAGEAIRDAAALHRYTTDIREGFVRAATYSVGDAPRFRG